MPLATCTVSRVGTKNNYQDDSQRLGLELNETNKYSGSFTGKIIQIDMQYAYVVKDTEATLHFVKLSELSSVIAV